MQAEELRAETENRTLPFPFEHRATGHYSAVANLLSISRLLVSPLIVISLVRSTPLGGRVALSLMVWALVSDVADGYIARRTDSRSRLGAILDPLSDKILIGSIVATLVLVRSLPVWIAGIIIMRDVCILLASGWVVRTKGVVLESNYLGKATGITFAAMIGAYTISLETLGLILAYLSVALVVVSSAFYTTRLLRLYNWRHK